MVIPTLNEADSIARTIAGVEPNERREVIVVDGGSVDDTVAIAKSLGARVIDGLPPKASQMNLGASMAAGEALFFLHADSRPPDRFDARILQCLREPGVAAGAFTLRIDSPEPGLRLIERLADFRSRRMGMPYGDQGIFLSSRVFHQIGGFPPIPIMEDFELIRRLRKKGRIAILPAPVVTSPRRWLNFGILKTTLINQIVIAAYLMGVSPQSIARVYRREKGVAGGRH
ncbi:MAG: glycosyltransferase family 2 protein [Desulfobacterales bacterium]|nr:glycosyltransferase family 2 protein [Desulfobacterales bacterium]